MKKILSFLFIICLSVGLLAACDYQAPEEPTFDAGITLPTFENNKLVLKVGDKLNLLEGVKAINEKGESVLENVTVSHLIPVDSEGKVTASGTYNVKFSVEIDGEMYLKYLTVEVLFEKPVTDDIIFNGNFETGSVDPFTKAEFDNGAATLSVVKDGTNNVLKVEITAVSWQQASPRLNYEGIEELDPNKFYEISFKAKADVARGIHVQIGQLLTEAPWYNQCGNDAWYASLTTEYQEFSYRFQPTTEFGADLSKLALLLEFGTMGKEGLASVVTNCYLDDIQIIEVDDLGLDNLLPMTTINGMGEEKVAVDNPGTGVVWYDQGAWCGTATVTESTFNNNVISLTATNPAGSCWFATQFFLASAPLEGGEYKLSFVLNSNKAGSIQLCGEKIEIVEGENKLSINKDVAKDAQFVLQLQFGTEALGNIGNFEATIEKVQLNYVGEIKAPVDYADPNNLFGKVSATLVNNDESTAKAAPGTIHYWYVQDASWGCGPVVPTSVTLDKGVLTINTNQPTDAKFWASQLFLATKPIEVAGTHTISLKINSTLAGSITVCGVKKDLVVGDNIIEVTIDNAVAAQMVLSMQLGYNEMVNEVEIHHPLVGEVKLMVSEIKVDNKLVEFDGAGQVVDPQPVDNLYKELSTEVVNDGEDAAKAAPLKYHYWYVQDANWGCGPVVNASATLNEGVLKLTTTQATDAYWFATQLFLATNTVAKGGSFDLSLNIKSNVATKITICQKVYDLVVGDNLIEEKVTIADGGKFVLSLQCGVDGTGASGNMELEVSNVSLKPATVVEPKPVDSFISLNSAVGGAWFYIKATWTDAANAVTAITPEKIVLADNSELAYTGEVGVSSSGEGFYQMGAGFADARFMTGTNKLFLSVTIDGVAKAYVLEFTGVNGTDLAIPVVSINEVK